MTLGCALEGQELARVVKLWGQEEGTSRKDAVAELSKLRVGKGRPHGGEVEQGDWAGLGRPPCCTFWEAG